MLVPKLLLVPLTLSIQKKVPLLANQSNMIAAMDLMHQTQKEMHRTEGA